MLDGLVQRAMKEPHLDLMEQNSLDEEASELISPFKNYEERKHNEQNNAMADAESA